MPAERMYRTGEVCPQSGVYAFVRHTNEDEREPTGEELEIPLAKGERFPPIRSTGTGAWWKLRRDA